MMFSRRFLGTILFGLVSIAATLQAQEPVLNVTLERGSSFDMPAPEILAIYPSSERVGEMISARFGGKVVAADMKSGILISTEDSRLAGQEILAQIGTSVGSPISRIQTSATSKLAPGCLLMGIGEGTVWHVLLTPTNKVHEFLLTVTLFISR
ncbi:hypothetical protein N9Z12_01865 [Opitutaceae bacterium]|nr:hypothetical protein [Opitutaceae bacterium]